jgi:RHS repeat-associated protein
MWNYIAGLGMKTFDYSYNSQSQLTELIYQSGYSDTKSFKYAYDYAGRLLNTSFNYIPSDSPEEYITFNSYTYNQNSQIYTSKFDPINLTHTYSYDSRSRITNYACGKPDLFSYNLTYYANSNIYTQSFTGQYKNSFSNQDNLSTSFTYDKSNRLLNANFTHTSDNTFDLTNTYDPDGNIITMQRYGSNNNLLDNFSYDYYSGTNRLKKVSGSSDQSTYDYNGNQTNDYLNNNTSTKYDHRNLITEFTRQDLTQDPPITNVTRYKYDEAGNRVRKTIYRSNDYEPSPLPEENEDLPSGWSIILDDYYLREVSGKEIAIYSSYTLQYWNVWSGSEIVGRINNTENVDRNYYLKDHLGSIRVVLDNSKTIVSANDYDMWGYYLQNRTYSPTNTKNKFTGKERDNESSYDYFGARYYDARIANWGSVDPKMEKSVSFSSYSYVLRNPSIYIDPKGEEWFYIWDKGGESGEWKYYENTPTKNIWTGKYDKDGNKTYEKQNGLIELLGFNGSKLTWYNEKGNTQSWNAVSGVLKDGKTQPDLQYIENYGPIPVGWWFVDPKESQTVTKATDLIDLLKYIGKYSDWGFSYTPIIPLGETYNIRNSFFIHGGLSPGSHGCIDLTSENGDFHSAFIYYNKAMILHVDYSKLK